MPSDTAFLGELRGGAPLAAAHNSLGTTIGDMPRKVITPMDAPDLSPRMLAGMVNNLRALGVDIDENNRILRGFRAAIMTNYSLYTLYNAWAAKARADQLRQSALAAVEAAEIAWIPFLGQKQLAEAALSAAMVTAFFAMGEKFGSGDWRLPHVNISNPVERRAAARHLTRLHGGRA